MCKTKLAACQEESAYTLRAKRWAGEMETKLVCVVGGHCLLCQSRRGRQ